eukprot:GDKI01009207.1.p1 GENE.GDKI01009207.1~~GDKI01009207.1.p1  ORF type:complete len:718 (+),score=202.11 GDKI01009207.1:170-2323(+)
MTAPPLSLPRPSRMAAWAKFIYDNRLMIPAFTVSLTVSVSITMFQPILLAIQTELDMSPAEYALALSCYAISASFASLLNGVVIDKLGFRWALRLSALFYVPVPILLLTMKHYGEFAAVRAFQGLGCGLGWAIFQAQLSFAYDASTANKRFAVMLIFYCVGNTIGPLITPAVIPSLRDSETAETVSRADLNRVFMIVLALVVCHIVACWYASTLMMAPKTDTPTSGDNVNTRHNLADTPAHVTSTIHDTTAPAVHHSQAHADGAVEPLKAVHVDSDRQPAGLNATSGGKVWDPPSELEHTRLLCGRVAVVRGSFVSCCTYSAFFSSQMLQFLLSGGLIGLMEPALNYAFLSKLGASPLDLSVAFAAMSASDAVAAQIAPYMYDYIGCPTVFAVLGAPFLTVTVLLMLCIFVFNSIEGTICMVALIGFLNGMSYGSVLPVASSIPLVLRAPLLLHRMQRDRATGNGMPHTQSTMAHNADGASPLAHNNKTQKEETETETEINERSTMTVSQLVEEAKLLSGQCVATSSVFYWVGWAACSYVGALLPLMVIFIALPCVVFGSQLIAWLCVWRFMVTEYKAVRDAPGGKKLLYETLGCCLEKKSARVVPDESPTHAIKPDDAVEPRVVGAVMLKYVDISRIDPNTGLASRSERLDASGMHSVQQGCGGSQRASTVLTQPGTPDDMAPFPPRSVGSTLASAVEMGDLSHCKEVVCGGDGCM